MAKRYTLVGPRAGQTVTLGGYSFVNGEYLANVSENDAVTLTPILRDYYSAYQDTELLQAQQNYAAAHAAPAAKVVADIVSEEEDEEAEQSQQQEQDPPPPPPVQDPPPPPPPPPPVQDPPPPPPPPVQDPPPPPPPPPPVQDPPPPPRPEQTLSEFIKALDPTVDANWTSRGGPAMGVIEAKFGNAVTRDQVEAAAPGWTRTKAKEAAAAAAALE